MEDGVLSGNKLSNKFEHFSVGLLKQKEDWNEMQESAFVGTETIKMCLSAKRCHTKFTRQLEDGFLPRLWCQHLGAKVRFSTS